MRPGDPAVPRGGTHVMHGRSRFTIDPCIPVMPERGTSDFHRPGRHCLHQARSTVRSSASRMKGIMGDLHPTTVKKNACEADLLA